MGNMPRPSLAALERAEAAARAAKDALDRQFTDMAEAAMAKAPAGLDDRQLRDLRADLLTVIRDAFWDQVCETEDAVSQADEAVGAEETRQQNSDYLGSIL
jgi:hypothetical protein